MTNIRFRAEWEPQSAILVAWPHAGTDWAMMLDRVQNCYREMVHVIAQEMPIIVVTPEPEVVKQQLAHIDCDRASARWKPTTPGRVTMARWL